MYMYMYTWEVSTLQESICCAPCMCIRNVYVCIYACMYVHVCMYVCTCMYVPVQCSFQEARHGTD